MASTCEIQRFWCWGQKGEDGSAYLTEWVTVTNSSFFLPCGSKELKVLFLSSWVWSEGQSKERNSCLTLHDSIAQGLSNCEKLRWCVVKFGELQVILFPLREPWGVLIMYWPMKLFSSSEPVHYYSACPRRNPSTLPCFSSLNMTQMFKVARTFPSPHLH